MTEGSIEIEGTLQADGTLVLDEKPNMPPGRVKIVLRQEPEPITQQEDWFQHLLRVRAEREAAGYPFMNDEEVNAHIEWLRGDDDRIEEIYRQIDEQRQTGEQQNC